MDKIGPSTTQKLVPMSLLILSGISIQIGSVFGVKAILISNGFYVSFLRSLFAFPVIFLVLLLQKKSFRGINYKLAFLVGVAISLLNTSYNLAISHISLGDTMGIQYTGAIVVSSIGARSKKEYIWIVLALLGVLAITRPGSDHVEFIGLFFAILAAISFGIYITVAKRIAVLNNRMQTMSIALLCSALILVPSSYSLHSSLIDGQVLLFAFFMAIFASVITAFIEITTLSKISTTVFGVLLGLYPVIAIGAGLLFLGQKPSLSEVIGILLVVVASIGGSLGRKVTPEMTPKNLS